MLNGKKILVGISGGIAAYKIPCFVRLLVQAGAEVKVVTTANALEFVSRLSLETVSGSKVYSNLFEEKIEKHTFHVSYSDWADILVIAPATANILGKMANGIADDALSTLYIAFYKKVIIAPAMNVQMYDHPAMKSNLTLLSNRGVSIIEPEEGDLACGYAAKGRMAEPETMLKYVESVLCGNDTYLQGKKVLVTAGPTQEDIDPVRYISNRSSGLMGFCIADELSRAGAEVHLVSGPCVLSPSEKLHSWIKVNTADEMFEACKKCWPDMQAGILSAAVADYKVKDISDIKIKKKEGNYTLVLSPNPDILKYLGEHKAKDQKLVGFALETNNAMANTKEKLIKKNADFMVLNTLEEGSGFNTTTNKVSLVSKEGVEDYPLENKKEVAKRIVSKLGKMLNCILSVVLFSLFMANSTKLQAQELNCTLQVMSSKIQSGDKKVFETLQKALVQFVNGRKWTNLQVGSGEKIPCSITIDIQERDFNTGATKAYITVQARRPVYNSSYNTNILNILDRDFSFSYNENDPLEFSDNNIGTNLTATLAFYSYLIIGEYLDSFANKAGEYCFGRAENIVNMAQSLSEIGWKSGERNNRNRYWTIESYMNGNYSLIHSIIYQYHRKGMDMMYENPTVARENIFTALYQIKELNRIKNNLPSKMIFMEAKVDEIISIFSAAPQEEKQKILDLLTEIDASNIQKYQRIVSAR